MWTPSQNDIVTQQQKQDAELAEKRNKPLGLQQFASARFTVDDGVVNGLERSSGFGFAFMISEDEALLFLEEEQPDTDYIAMPPEGITKYTDHLIVKKPNLTELSFLLFRVQ